MRSSCFALVLSLCAILLPDALAQNQGEPASRLDPYYVDFSVPDLSAFTLLGVESSRISRPGNVRALSSALTNSLSSFGEKGTGLEVAPFQLAHPNSLASYNGIRDRLTISAAAVQDEGGGTRLGLGVRWVPIDRADPYDSERLQRRLQRVFADSRGAYSEEAARQLSLRTDLRRFWESIGLPREAIEEMRRLFSFEDAPSPVRRRSLPEALRYVESEIAKLLEQSQPGIQQTLSEESRRRLHSLIAQYRVEAARQTETLSGLDADFAAAVTSIRTAFRDSTWNALAIQIAIGATAGTPGSVEDLEAQTLGGFSSLAFPLGRRGQGIIHLQAALPLDNGARSFSAGGRVLFGSAVRRFSVEGLYGSNDDRLDGERYRVLVGGEFRLSDGVYLELATGLNLPGEGDSSFFTLGGLKYGLGQGQRFKLAE